MHELVAADKEILTLAFPSPKKFSNLSRNMNKNLSASVSHKKKIIISMNYHQIFIKIYFIILILVSSGYLYAQFTPLDSLKQLLAQTTDDSLRAQLLIDIDSKDPFQSIEYSEEALEIFTKLNHRPGIVAALNKTGYNYWKLGNFNEAIDYYYDGLKIADELGDSSWIARISNNLGAVYWGLSDYNKALELYQKALTIRTREKDKRSMSIILNNIGLIYQRWQLFDQAFEYHENALKLAESLDDYFTMAYSFHNIGFCYQSKNKFNEALEAYRKSYMYYLDSGNEGGATSLALRSIGDIYFEKQDYDKALEYYYHSLRDAFSETSIFRASYSQFSIGKTYSILEQYDSAEHYIEASLKTSQNMGYNDLLRDNYLVMSEMHENKGQFDQALSYYKISMAINDSIFNKDKIAKFNELQIRYNLEKQEQENELLRKNMEIQALQMRRDRLFRIGLLAGLMFILFVSFYIYYQSKKLKTTNTVLEKQNEEILKINREKELILKEVHHRIKNNMNTMKSLLALQAKSVSEASAKSALTDAGNRLQSMGVLYEKLYRSENIRQMSVRHYLESLIDEIVSVFPHQDLVRIEKEIEDVPLDVKTLSALGIIVTELITNAMKYAFPNGRDGLIRLTLVKSDRILKLTVMNSGKTLPDNFRIEQSEGFGLRLVSMLTQQINGNIDIYCGNNVGFTVEFPLKTE